MVKGVYWKEEKGPQFAYDEFSQMSFMASYANLGGHSK